MYYVTIIESKYRVGTYEYLVKLINESPYIHLHKINKLKKRDQNNYIPFKKLF